MANRVEEHEMVSLNGVEYPLKEGSMVRHVLSSQYAPKVVIGDTSKDSQQRASVLAWIEWRDGIGLEQIEGSGDTTRAWWSTLQLRYKKHLVLPPLSTQTAVSGVSGSFTIGAMGERANEVYAAFGTDVRKYNNASDSWGSSLFTLPLSATDSLNVVMSGTEYLIFATGGGYTYYNGSATDDSTLATDFLAFWDDRLWGIDDQGQLWHAVAIGTEVPDALLPVTAGTVTGLFVGRSPAGNLVLYASTTKGLFIHDVDNAQFVETELALPFHPDNGKGHLRWRDATYISSGLGVYKYVNGTNSAVVTVVGPDRDHGVPSDRRGTIRQLVATHNELLAIIDATTAPSATSVFTGGDTNQLALGVGGSSPVAEQNTGYSWIGGFDERGWQVIWLSAAATSAITSTIVSNAYNSYRLWFSQNQRIYWIQMQRDIINPNEVSTFTYATSGRHETPWFDAGQAEVDKLCLRLKVEAEDMGSNETAKVYFATDGNTSWTQLTDTYTSDSTFTASSDAITGDGVTTFSFPAVTAPTGTTFRSIRFRIDLARGGTTTLSPDIISITMEWRKKIPAQWAHLVTVDLTRLNDMTGESSGRTQEQLFDTIRTAVESNTLVEFTFRNRDANDSGTSNPYNYYVDIAQVSGMEKTGDDWGTEIQMTLVEV